MTAILSHPEREALAILRIGGSFDDAMKHSGLTLEQVQKLWKEHGDK